MPFKFTYEKLSALFPRKLITTVARLMEQGGFIKITPRAYLGFSLFFSLSLSFLAFFVVQVYTLDAFISAGIPLGVFLLSIAFFYVLLLISADARASEIEQVLPHALQIMSTNLRAGMTLENAVWGAARPEFGVFQEEIKRVAADSFGGVPITVALNRLSGRVRSPMLERAVKLISQGISLGGDMSSLLENVANDIRTLQKLKQEVITSTTTYAIFIVFAAVIISPLLFSISVFYAELNQNTFQKKAASSNIDASIIQESGFAGTPIFVLGSKSSINFSDIEKLFALASIIITSISAAFILALIQSGTWIKGVFYAPLFLLISMAVFFLSSSVLRAILSPTFA